MRIVLEGPDLSGKSTVGQKLSDITGLAVFHHGKRPKTIEELKRRVASIHDNVIYDRHPAISELIYSKALNRKPLATETELLKLVDEQLIVFCYPGWEHLQSKMEFLITKKHKTKYHVKLVRENYGKIITGYMLLMHNLKNVVCVDFRKITKKQLENIVNEHK